MNKVSNNSLLALKDFFYSEMVSILGEREAELYFERLCQDLLGIDKAQRILSKDIRLSESQILLGLNAIKELKTKRPLAYVLGVQYFYGLPISVKEGVLIPRPETEELVQWVTEEKGVKLKVIDMCSGSGCIGLAIKNQKPSWEVMGYDVSDEALRQSRGNALKLDLACDFLRYDLLDEKSELKLECDIIVGNPPYVLESEKLEMDESVLNFEPTLALFVNDQQPLLFYEKISDFALTHLRREGALFFEINECFGLMTLKMLQAKGFSSIELRKDMQGKDRMIKAIK